MLLVRIVSIKRSFQKENHCSPWYEKECLFYSLQYSRSQTYLSLVIAWLICAICIKLSIQGYGGISYLATKVILRMMRSSFRQYTPSSILSDTLIRYAYDMRFPDALRICAYQMRLPFGLIRYAYYMRLPDAPTGCTYDMLLPDALTGCTYDMCLPDALTICAYQMR